MEVFEEGPVSLRQPMSPDRRRVMEEYVAQGANMDELLAVFGQTEVEAFYSDPYAPETVSGDQDAA